jgi:hypothetical protein
VSRRGECCGYGSYFLRCRRAHRYRNVSVGDGVLDVPTFGSPPDFASDDETVRLWYGRVPLSLGRALHVLYVRVRWCERDFGRSVL